MIGDIQIFNLLIEKKYDLFADALHLIYRKMELDTLQKQMDRDKKAMFNIRVGGLDCIEYKLGDITEIERGKSLPKSQMIDGIFPVISGCAEIKNYHNETNCDGNKYVFIARVGSAGDALLCDKKCYLTDLAFALKNNKNICDKLYLYYSVKYNNINMKKIIQTNGPPNINGDALKELIILLPSIEEQKKIILDIELINTEQKSYETYSKLIQSQIDLISKVIIKQELKTTKPIKLELEPIIDNNNDNDNDSIKSTTSKSKKNNKKIIKLEPDLTNNNDNDNDNNDNNINNNDNNDNESTRSLLNSETIEKKKTIKSESDLDNDESLNLTNSTNLKYLLDQEIEPDTLDQISELLKEYEPKKDDVLINLSVKKINNLWKKNASQFISKDYEKITNKDKYLKCRKDLLELKNLKPPKIVYVEQDNTINFLFGSNMFANLRNFGYKNIPVITNNSTKKYFENINKTDNVVDEEKEEEIKVETKKIKKNKSILINNK